MSCQRVLGDRAEVDRREHDVERSAAEAGEVEQVADQPLEAVRLTLDHFAGTLRVKTPSLRPSACPRIAVNGVFSSWLIERRKARSASCARRNSSDSSLNDVDSCRSSSSPRPAAGRLRSLREPLARLGDASHGPRHGTCEQKCDAGRESEPSRAARARPTRNACESSDCCAPIEAARLRLHLQVGLRRNGSPRTETVPLARALLRRRSRRSRGESSACSGVRMREALLLGREEASDLGVAPGEWARDVLGGDQVHLAAQRSPCVLVQRAPRQRSADGEHDDGGDGDGGGDADVEPRPKPARRVDPAQAAACIRSLARCG